jgi:hypothetical protein
MLDELGNFRNTLNQSNLHIPERQRMRERLETVEELGREVDG